LRKADLNGKIYFNINRKQKQTERQNRNLIAQLKGYVHDCFDGINPFRCACALKGY